MVSFPNGRSWQDRSACCKHLNRGFRSCRRGVILTICLSLHIFGFPGARLAYSRIRPRKATANSFPKIRPRILRQGICFSYFSAEKTRRRYGALTLDLAKLWCYKWPGPVAMVLLWLHRIIAHQNCSVRLTWCGLALRLVLPSVWVEVDVTNWTKKAGPAAVRVNGVHKIRVPRVQPVPWLVGPEQRPSGVKTLDRQKYVWMNVPGNHCSRL